MPVCGSGESRDKGGRLFNSRAISQSKSRLAALPQRALAPARSFICAGWRKGDHDR